MVRAAKVREKTTTIEVNICLITRYKDLVFREFLLGNWCKRLFITGRLADDLSIELFVDNILDNLQWREVELLHFMLKDFIEDYFDLFIVDLTETIIHEYIHYLERSLPEEWVRNMSRLVKEAMVSKARPIGPNLIILGAKARMPD